MLRKCMIFCALMTIAYGCSKKKPTATETPTEPPSANSNANSNSVAVPSNYFLKIRDEKVGDKSLVTEAKSELTAFTLTIAGLKGTKTDPKKSAEKSEYIEVVHALKPGEIFPTKFTREYKHAEFKKGNEASKPTSYSGKTVSFEKTFGHYSVLVDKNSLPVDEDRRFNEALERLDKIKYSEMVPKTPVRLNEPWYLDSVLVDRMGKVMGFPPSEGKSQASGKLINVYSKAGKQWGVIEFKYDYVIEGNYYLDEEQQIGLTVTGNIAQTWTVDIVMDGSSNEAITKRRSYGTVELKGKDIAGTVKIDKDYAETRTPVK